MNMGLVMPKPNNDLKKMAKIYSLLENKKCTTDTFEPI